MTTAWTPETVDLDLLLREHGAKVAERVLWLGHIVYGRMVTDPRARDDGAAPLMTSQLRDVLGRHHLDRVRDVAESIGYIGRNRSYRAGVVSQTYRILPPHNSSRIHRHTLTDRGLCRAIARVRERQRASTWERIREGRTLVAPDICQHLWDCLKRVDLADDFEPGTPYEQIAADRMRHRRHWFVVDDFGRVHTPLTSLPRTIRPFLRVEGEPITGTDVGESQPLAIGLAIADHTRATTGTAGGREGEATTGAANLMLDKMTYDWHIPTMLDIFPDLRKFLTCCEGRQLYQTVADRLGVPRETAKRHVMTVFFGRPHYRTRASEALDALFPGTMRAMRRMKRDDHCALAHWAQRAESSFIYGQCIRRLMNENAALWLGTIHDSILTTEDNERIVESIMRSEFARLGLNPTLTVEQFAKQDLSCFGKSRTDSTHPYARRAGQ